MRYPGCRRASRSDSGDTGASSRSPGAPCRRRRCLGTTVSAQSGPSCRHQPRQHPQRDWQIVAAAVVFYQCWCCCFRSEDPGGATWVRSYQTGPFWSTVIKRPLNNQLSILRLVPYHLLVNKWQRLLRHSQGTTVFSPPRPHLLQSSVLYDLLLYVSNPVVLKLAPTARFLGATNGLLSVML